MILIKGGKIKPITGAEIENGELLIGDDGKIAAIGKTVDAPADAKVIDATGCLVTPGFIDAHCHIGIDEEGMRWEGNDCNEYSSPVTPEMRSIDGINPRDEAFHLALEGGVSLKMEKILAGAPKSAEEEGAVKSHRVLEVNAKHPVFEVMQKAQEAGDDEKVKLYSGILYDQALLVEGIPLDDPVAYTEAVTKLMK